MKKININYVLSDNRTKMTGNLTLKKYDDVMIGDFVSSCRTDKETGLPIFWEVASKGAWGVHNEVLLSKNERWVWVNHRSETFGDEKFQVINNKNKIK